MSGYLQRLVSSAMRPTPRLHPVVAVWFSTPEHVIREEERTEQEAMPARAPSQKPANAESDVDSRSGNPNVEISKKYVPLIPETIPGQDDFVQPQPTRSAVQVFADESYNREIMQRVGRADPKESSASNATYKPLLPERPAAISESKSDPHLESLLTAVPQSQSGSVAKAEHLAAKKHEPDEIQITIGRIEVTAVPEATRPGTKPARKQFSLDEYLKRADARGR
jgi:hypothetical protein